MSSHTYTTQAEMDRLFSQLAREERVDDFGQGASNTNVIDDMIEDATSTIDAYVLRFYDADVLVNARWVRRRATVFACHYLSQRRGNPALFTQWIDRIMKELEMIAQGKLIIPDVASRGDGIPSVTNYLMDARFGTKKDRVDLINTTGGTYNGIPAADLDHYLI
jgi:phage gp36-like protein